MAKNLIKSNLKFARNCILARKLAVTKFATSASCKTLYRINRFFFQNTIFLSFTPIFQKTKKTWNLKWNATWHKPTNHVSREWDYFVFRMFWFILCLRCRKNIVEKCCWKNVVENWMSKIGLKANESRFSGMRFFRFQNVWDWFVFSLRKFFMANFGLLTMCRFTQHNTRFALLRIL